MAFVNEYISDEDVAKYGIAQLRDELHFDYARRCNWEWTRDRERDAYLTQRSLLGRGCRIHNSPARECRSTPCSCTTACLLNARVTRAAFAEKRLQDCRVALFVCRVMRGLVEAHAAGIDGEAFEAILRQNPLGHIGTYPHAAHDDVALLRIQLLQAHAQFA